MKISLITVCYKSVHTLPTALESVLRQTDVDLDYHVVDGNSEDGTIELLQSYAPKFAGRLHWTSEPDCGMYDAINKGLARATGDVVGILNADDFLDTDHALADVAAAFAARPAAQALYADVRFIACEDSRQDLDTLRAAPTRRYFSSRAWRPWMSRWGFMPAHPTVYIRRDQFARLGGYKLDYAIAADCELMIRYLKKAALPSFYLPECLVTMRMGGKSTNGWRTNLHLNRENVRANRENCYWTCLPMMLPKYLFKIWEFILPRRH